MDLQFAAAFVTLFVIMKLNLLTSQTWKNQTVLVRVDYNVPLEQKNGRALVRDPRRILASRETIEFLRARGNKVVLLSHLGRPKSAADTQFSLAPVATYLQKNTDWPVEFIEDYTDVATTKARLEAAASGTVFLLENVRFHDGEKKNDPAFVQLLANYGTAFVNEAFSASHRAHASVVGLAGVLPAVAGIALASEVKAFTNLLESPVHPFIVVVGGAKISDKIDPIVNLSKVADAVLIGGGVANNFLKAVGLAVQKSYLQDAPADLLKEGLNYVDVADQIIQDNRQFRLLKDGYIPLPKIIYPVDVLAADGLESRRASIVELTSNATVCQKCNQMYLDIGPKTVRLYRELILQAETVFWNGPMGAFEYKPFASGTKEVARAVAKTGGVTLVGGGDTIAALDKYGYYQSVDYVSMAGSAALEFLSGKPLPGLLALEKTS